MKYRYDEDELLQTAKVVMALNPFANFIDHQALVDHMKRCAEANLTDGPGYLAVFGFVLSTFWWDSKVGGDLGVKASVSSHLVERNLEKLSNG